MWAGPPMGREADQPLGGEPLGGRGAEGAYTGELAHHWPVAGWSSVWYDAVLREDLREGWRW